MGRRVDPTSKGPVSRNPTSEVKIFLGRGYSLKTSAQSHEKLAPPFVLTEQPAPFQDDFHERPQTLIFREKL